jgi:thiosulfate/3-mercaptopyruvate sulfurtransferase
MVGRSPIPKQKALLGPFLLTSVHLGMPSPSSFSAEHHLLDAFLVEPEALLATFADLDGLIIDARSAEAYAAGHIPGAISVSTYDNFVPNTKPEGMRAFANQAAALYGAAGITLDTPVLVYDDDTGVRVARECWLLEYLGHRHVRLLHGGLNAWQQCGGPISTTASVNTPQQFEIQHSSAGFVSADSLVAEFNQPKRVVIDVRDELEHDGLDHTACCERRGHVPGAVWIHWSEFLERGRFKSGEAIRDLLHSRGIREDDELAPYCHRGARSANTYWALRLAGYPQVRNYIGSWHEWSARSELPLELGHRQSR